MSIAARILKNSIHKLKIRATLRFLITLILFRKAGKERAGLYDAVKKVFESAFAAGDVLRQQRHPCNQVKDLLVCFHVRWLLCTNIRWHARRLVFVFHFCFLHCKS